MLAVLACSRSQTPVTVELATLNHPGRRSHMLSTTTHPSRAGSKSYCQRATGNPATEVTSKPNRPPGSASVMVDRVLHRRNPRRLRPRNFAPTEARLPRSLTAGYPAVDGGRVMWTARAGNAVTAGLVGPAGRLDLGTPPGEGGGWFGGLGPGPAQFSRRSMRLTPAATVVARIQPEAVKPAATQLSGPCMYHLDLLPKSTIGTSRSAV